MAAGAAIVCRKGPDPIAWRRLDPRVPMTPARRRAAPADPAHGPGG
jgi:hypothetical protein